MVTLENIGHRIKNVPAYIRHTMKKNKNAPFHWTTTQKQQMQKEARMNTRRWKRYTNRSINKKVNEYCKELNGMASMSLREEQYYTQHCLTPENVENLVNLNEANLSFQKETQPRTLHEIYNTGIKKLFKRPVNKSVYPYLRGMPHRENLAKLIASQRSTNKAPTIQNWKGGKTKHRGTRKRQQ